jgi:hypothetical protein
MRARRFIATMGAAAVAASQWPLAAMAASTISAGHSVLGQAPSSTSPGHLYVLDNNRAVYRFPLAQDGLPDTRPDGVMYPQGAVYPQGIAVDKAGHVFVADPNGWGGAVAEFAAGSVGQQQPISILNLSGDNPDRLKIDDAERLYVHYNKNQDLAIFAKGAHGNDAPISVVPPFPGAWFIIDYVIGPRGTLYALNSVYPLAVYDDPIHNPSSPNGLIWPDGGHAFNTTVAFDAATDRIYIQFYVSSPHYWEKVNYDVRAPSGNNAAAYNFIFTGDCGSTQESFVGGTVIVKKYLIVSCNSNSDILVYRTDQFGRQRKPVETVGKGTLSGNWEIAVGP